MWEDSQGLRGRSIGELGYAVVWLTRILAQVESQLLSAPNSTEIIPRVLEQIFEDLNNYSETSIYLDPSNYLELKVFPFFRECAGPAREDVELIFGGRV